MMESRVAASPPQTRLIRTSVGAALTYVALSIGSDSTQVSAAALCLGALLLVNSTSKLRPSSIILLAFAGLTSIASFLITDTNVAAIAVPVVALVVFALSEVASSRNGWRFLDAFLAAAAAHGVVAAILLALGLSSGVANTGFRPENPFPLVTYRDAAFLTNSLSHTLILGLIALCFGFRLLRRAQRTVGFLMLFSGLYLVVVAGYRVGLAVAAGTTLLLFRKKRSPVTSLQAQWIGALALTLPLWWWAASQPFSVVFSALDGIPGVTREARIETLSEQIQTLQGRTMIWDAALGELASRDSLQLLLGTQEGTGQLDQLDQLFSIFSDAGTLSAHNTLLQQLLTLGCAGLFVLGFLLRRLSRMMRHFETTRPEYLALVIAMLAVGGTESALSLSSGGTGAIFAAICGQRLWLENESKLIETRRVSGDSDVPPPMWPANSS